MRRYLDSLTDALVVRQVQPWFANVGKRQIRSPKVYVRDSGLLHRLLGIDDALALDRHPKVGASWEGFVIEQLSLVLDSTYVYFWGTNRGAELDLYTELSGRRIGFEIKRTSVPRRTRSMHSAIADLELDQLVFVYPGERQFPLGERMAAVPAGDLLAARNAKELLSVLASEASR